MTEQQYKAYEKISEEIAPLKNFLFWCGNRYRERSVTKYECRLVTKAKELLIGRKGCGGVESREILLPRELQDKIIEVVENYVEEKEKELEQL